MRIAILTIFLIIASLYRISPILMIIPICLMIYEFFKYNLRNKSIQFYQLIGINKLIFLFAFLVIIGILRSNKPEPYEIAVFHASILLMIIMVFNVMSYYYFNKIGDWNKLLINFTVIPFSLFGFFNIVLFFFGVRITGSAYETEDIRQTVLMSNIFGFNLSRVEFPLVAGINSYSIYVGAILCVALLLFIFYKKYRIITSLSTLLFCTTLLFTDSRGALIYPFLIAALIFFIRKKSDLPFYFKYLTWVIVLGPFLFMFLMPFLARFDLFQGLSRSQGDLETGNARFFIWSVSANEFFSFKLIHLIGYGEYGHYGSGVSRQWAAGESGIYKDAEISLTSHNSMFAILFDYGYLGLVVYLALIWQLFKRIAYIWKRNKMLSYPLLAYMVYNIIAGVTESFGSAIFFNYMLLFIMMAMIINLSYYLYKKSMVNVVINSNVSQSKDFNNSVTD